MSSNTTMAIAPRPITAKPVPKNVSATKPQPAAPSPGRFCHPRMTEIAKRRAATSFTAQNVQTVLLNAALIIASFIGGTSIHPIVTKLVETTSLDHLPIAIDASRILLSLRLFLLANILFALRPILPYVSESDHLEDVALTSSQRALLGLIPSQPNTPQTPIYVTPPRYVRSSLPTTSQSNHSTDRRSISANYTPQSTPRYSPATTQNQSTASATPTRRMSGSPFASNPLYNKALTNSTSQNSLYSQGDFTESTRSLLAGRESTGFFPGGGSGSLRRSTSMREPGTPSPSGKERMKVKLEPGLNYKWLYEKGLKVGKNGGIEY